MGQPSPEKKPVHTLAALDAKWRAEKGDFHLTVCQALGTDREAYRRLTEEIIAEHVKDKDVGPSIPELSSSFHGIKRALELSLKYGASEIAKDVKMSAAINTWLGVVEEMNAELGNPLSLRISTRDLLDMVDKKNT